MGTCRLSSADMKNFIVFTCLLVSQALAKPSKRAADEGHEGECCAEKRVGEILYQLFSEGDASQLARYNCLNGCIYKDEVDPEGPSFCFAHGDLPVECMDDFHWCYEGNCGPEFWETPIDVEWPENSLPNALPGPLTFEGYDRLRTAELSSEIADRLGKDHRLDGEVVNNGHTAVLGVVHETESDGIMTGPVLGEGQSYQMLQLHFHWGADDSKGSEHTINGEEFPMEMHIVHKKVGLTVEEALATSDGLAVVGQMFQISAEDNAVLTPLLPSPDGEYANYDGSLTTP